MGVGGEEGRVGMGVGGIGVEVDASNCGNAYMRLEVQHQV